MAQNVAKIHARDERLTNLHDRTADLENGKFGRESMSNMLEGLLGGPCLLG